MASQSFTIVAGRSVAVSLGEAGSTVRVSGATVSYSGGTITNGSSVTLYGTDTLAVAAGGNSATVQIIAPDVPAQSLSVTAPKLGGVPVSVRQRIRMGTSDALVAYDPEVIDARDWDNVRPWKSALTAKYRPGNSYIDQIAHGSDPFITAADIGSLVVVNIDSQAFKWMTTIVDVDPATKRVTIADAAPTGSTGDQQRMNWGPDSTEGMQAALDAAAADTAGAVRRVVLPGLIRASQLVVNAGVDFEAYGWGRSYDPFQAGSGIWQLPGSNVDLIVGDKTAVGTDGATYYGPIRVAGLTLFGPETGVQNKANTLGSGFALRAIDGSALIATDGVFLDRIHAIGFPEHGLEFPGGGVPLYISNCRAFYNGGAGAKIGDSTVTNNSQAIHLENFSADGNPLGGALFRNLRDYNSVTITALKSEKGRWQPNPGANVGDQEWAVVFDECDNTPVVIDGITHICAHGASGTNPLFGVAPGPAILVKSTTTKRPRIEYHGVVTRLIGDETDNVANAVTLRDNVLGIDLPRVRPSGHWPPDARLNPDRDALPVTFGESSLPRGLAGASCTVATGNQKGCLWTARTEATYSGITVNVNAAATSSTACKAFLATEDPSTGALTIVEAISSTNKLDSTGRQKFTFTTPRKVLSGQRVAVFVFWTGSGTTPSVAGMASQATLTTSTDPRLSAQKNGLSDIQSSPIAKASLDPTGNIIYAELTI